MSFSVLKEGISNCSCSLVEPNFYLVALGLNRSFKLRVSEFPIECFSSTIDIYSSGIQPFSSNIFEECLNVLDISNRKRFLRENIIFNPTDMQRLLLTLNSFKGFRIQGEILKVENGGQNQTNEYFKTVQNIPKVILFIFKFFISENMKTFL